MIPITSDDGVRRRDGSENHVGGSAGRSIRRIARKIDGSYSWVYDWIERLEEAGFIRRDDGVYIEDYTVRDRYHEMVAAISRSVAPSIDEGYVIPHFAEMPFAYTKIDSVYVWTHGG